MITEKNKKILTWHQLVTWLFVFLTIGSFLCGKNVLAYTGDYNKVDGSLLGPTEWNNLINDFVVIRTGGLVGIGTTNPLTNLQIGSLTSGSTASPSAISLGGSYSNTPGANAKFRMYDVGDGITSTYGLGVSSAQFEFLTASDAHYSWFIGGAEKMRLTNNGNVGIGTTIPSSKLQVNGATGFINNGVTQLSALGAAGNVIVMADNNGTLYTSSAASSLLWSGSTSGNIWNANSGNVGIGTNNPGAKLDVNGSFRLNRPSTMVDSINTIGGNIAFVPSTLSATDNGYLNLYYPTATSVKFATNYDGNLGGTKYRDVIFGRYGGDDYLTIREGGNVGIGTTAPFGIAGYTTTAISGTTGGILELMTGSTRVMQLSNNATSVALLTLGTQPLIFGTNAAEKMRIDSAGNVGIGTTGPGAKLEITGGGIKTLSATVTGLGSAGNVMVMADNSGNLYSTTTTSFLTPIMSSSSLWSGIKNGNIYNGDAGLGNVGIGTTTPGAALDVYGGSAKFWHGGTAEYTVFTANNEINHYTAAGAGAPLFIQYSSNASTNIGRGALFVNGNNGSVGIGTTNPGTKLEVYGGDIKINSAGNGSWWMGTDGSGAYLEKVGNNVSNENVRFQSSKSGDSTNYSQLIIDPTSGFSFSTIGTGNGNVGIGTTTPISKLQINGATGFINNGVTQLGALGAAGNVVVMADNNGTLYTSPAGSSLLWSGTKDGNIWNGTAGVGNVGIGTTAPTEARLVINAAGGMALKAYGNGIFTGTLQTQTGADFAEEFATTKKLETGTVVVMDDNGYKSVRPSDKSYDGSVVGIVSNNPSIIAGRINSKYKAVIAMMGVVKVKVSDVNGEISKGDLLTTSNISGYAMKSTEFKPGTIIGKALENLNQKTGEINVLVNLQ